jgi:taurine transport system ATP-binding protein
VVERLVLDFGRRYTDGQPVRQVQSSPEFIAARERVLEHVFSAHPVAASA